MKKTVLSAIILGLSFLLLFLAGRYHGFAGWYAVHIYPLFTRTLGIIIGIVPFSVAEITLYALILILTGSFFWMIIKLIRRKAGGMDILLYISRILLGASMLFLIYTLWCGINYQRISFAEQEGILQTDYTETELKLLCIGLTEDVNLLSQIVDRDVNGAFVLDGSEAAGAAAALTALGKDYSILGGSYPQVKRLLVPGLLSVQKLSGIYSPFTLEANYNNEMTAYNVPFTACHELAHLRGFMEEEEANFIAYLACMKSDSPAFQYSGSLLAWSYSMNVLYKEDLEAYRDVSKRLDESARFDLKENNAFWGRYESKVAQVANMVNDSYLKAHGKKDGVKSYGRMVDLLIAWQKRLV